MSDDLWAAVQARFAGRKPVQRGQTGYRRTRSPIAGLFTCQCGGSLTLQTGSRKGHSYTRAGCARHKNRGPEVCGNGTLMRLDVLAAPLVAFLRDELLVPDRLARAASEVNRKVEALLSFHATTGKLAALRIAAGQIEREVGNLVDAIEKAPASSALVARLAERERQLVEARGRIADVEGATARTATPASVTPREVAARIQALRADLDRLDSDRARAALGQIFDSLTVTPLNGSWEKGWTIELKQRPWAEVFQPKGAVVSTGGCGGAMINFLSTANTAMVVPIRGRIHPKSIFRGLRGALLSA